MKRKSYSGLALFLMVCLLSCSNSNSKKNEVSVTGVTLNKTSLSLGIGETDTLVATVQPSNATNLSVKWSSSNPEISSVTTNGSVSAKVVGESTVTVTTEDGGYTAKCAVAVTEFSQNNGSNVPLSGPGSLDSSFGSKGSVVTSFCSASDQARAVAIDADGKILAAGISDINTYCDIAVARYLSDGSLDKTFGGGDGIVITDIYNKSSDGANSILIQPDGKIVVAGGSTDSLSSFAVLRYKSDGSLDSTFGGGDGIVTTQIGSGAGGKAAVLQSDGKIVVAGYSNNGVNTDISVVRYNTDGSLDSSFGGGDGIVITNIENANDCAYGIALSKEGSFFVTGDSYGILAILKYESDGDLDSTFGGGDGIVRMQIGSSYNRGNAVTLDTDGNPIVTGYAFAKGEAQLIVVRCKSNGDLDTTFSDDGIAVLDIGSDEEVGYAINVTNSGTILVAGKMTVDETSQVLLLRLQKDGNLDKSFGNEGITSVNVGNSHDRGYAMAVQNDGKILVAGESYTNSVGDFLLIRYNID